MPLVSDRRTGPWGTGPFTLVEGYSTIDTLMAIQRGCPVVRRTCRRRFSRLVRSGCERGECEQVHRGQEEPPR
jgi:hypothetical protein